ncbi:Chloramphenicol phosphotransferase-like protein [compost metagenome]
MFEPFDVYFVALHCELAELVRRETLRSDRPIGSAADDFHRIHEGQRYDLQLHSRDAAEDNAAKLISAWTLRRSPSVFDELALKARSKKAVPPR